MNKIACFRLFCLFILSGQLMGENIPETIILLESKNQRGVELNKEVVIIKNSDVLVNGEKISASEIITQSGALTEISKFPKTEKGKACESGLFRHLYKKDKITKLEHGCLGSSRYNHLMKNFKALKKDTLIK